MHTSCSTLLMNCFKLLSYPFHIVLFYFTLFTYFSVCVVLEYTFFAVVSSIFSFHSLRYLLFLILLFSSHNSIATVSVQVLMLFLHTEYILQHYPLIPSSLLDEDYSQFSLSIMSQCCIPINSYI